MTDARPIAVLTDGLRIDVEAPLAALGLRLVRRRDLQDAERAAVRVIAHLGDVVLTPDALLALPNLKLIACLSVGYDGVDVAWCRAHGIEVTHADGLNADEVSDHALGLLLGGWRRIVVGDEAVRSGAWRRDKRLAGAPRSLRGLQAGIVGLGHIGQGIAHRVESLGMRVAWWGPRDKPAAWPRAASLLDLARDSDVLMVACRADAANRGLISAQVLDAVGPEGMIVNVSRGSVIDEPALVEALKAGRLGRAGLDVFETEPTPAERWADTPNVVLTPHMGGGSADSLPRLVGQTVENIRRHMAGEPLLSPAPN